jgi:hypothetical protein
LSDIWTGKGCLDGCGGRVELAVLATLDVTSQKKNFVVDLPINSITTLMPPPHRFLASRLQGYVCRACLSKSQVTLRQQPIWLSRNATDGRWPTILKGASQQVDPQEPEIRLFEQTPDGTRVEVHADLLNGIEGQLRGYDEENGHSIEELVGPVDFESFLDGDGQHYSYDPKLRESMDAMTKETEELEALVEKLENIDFGTLSAEDRAKLREELLQTATTGI